jgi:hypothetical protein
MYALQDAPARTANAPKKRNKPKHGRDITPALLGGHRREGSLALRSMSDPKSEDNQILMEVQTGKQSNVALPHKQMNYCGTHKQRCLKPLVLHLTIGSQEQMTLETLIMLQE